MKKLALALLMILCVTCVFCACDFIEETYEAGIVLKGTEIKSIRAGKCNIKDSYAIIKNNEAYLLNTHISQYKEGNIFNHDPLRTRKLLLHKIEITSGVLQEESSELLKKFFRELRQNKQHML